MKKDNEVLMTAQTKENLQTILENMRSKHGTIAAEKMDAVDSQGDTHDNFAYEDAIRRLELSLHGITDVEEKLRNAKIIQPNKDTKAVGVGHEVTVRLGETTQDFLILGPLDSDPPNGRISFQSPIARALLSHKSHERVQITTPDGVIQGEILAIKPGSF